MLSKIYCLFKAEPEEISGFADFVKELEKRKMQLEQLDMQSLSELVGQKEKLSDCLLITDMELAEVFLDTVKSGEGYANLADRIKKVMPVAGFLGGAGGAGLSYKYVFESFEGMTSDYFIMVYSRFHGLPLEILETERLCVREMALDDIDRLYEIYAEPSITEYMEGLYPDKKDELEFSKSYIENMYGFYGYGLWMVIEKASGRIIGRAGLSNREVDGETYLELGYVIAKESQGRGYATEVCRAILEYAKNELDAAQVIALMKPENEASIRTARKLGFHEVCEVTLGAEGEQYLEFCKEL